MTLPRVQELFNIIKSEDCGSFICREKEIDGGWFTTLGQQWEW